MVLLLDEMGFPLPGGAGSGSTEGGVAPASPSATAAQASDSSPTSPLAPLPQRLNQTKAAGPSFRSHPAIRTRNRVGKSNSSRGYNGMNRSAPRGVASNVTGRGLNALSHARSRDDGDGQDLGNPPFFRTIQPDDDCDESVIDAEVEVGDRQLPHAQQQQQQQQRHLQQEQFLPGAWEHTHHNQHSPTSAFRAVNINIGPHVNRQTHPQPRPHQNHHKGPSRLASRYGGSDRFVESAGDSANNSDAALGGPPSNTEDTRGGDKHDITSSPRGVDAIAAFEFDGDGAGMESEHAETTRQRAALAEEFTPTSDNDADDEGTFNGNCGTTPETRGGSADNNTKTTSRRGRHGHGDGEGRRKKHQPRHKNARTLEPILKRSSDSGSNGSTDAGRRVTISALRGGSAKKRHAGSGAGEDVSVGTGVTGDDQTSVGTEASYSVRGGRSSALEGCPFLHDMSDFTDEMRGSYKDTKMALRQVLNAFVIGPDDIDQISKRIQSAKLEMKDTYARKIGREREGGEETGPSTKKALYSMRGVV